MIIAVSELMSPKEHLMSKGQFLIAGFAGILWVLLLLISVSPSYAVEAAASGLATAAHADPSCARIVITKANYLQGSRSSKNDYVPLPEIARRTMYRYFGKTSEGASAEIAGSTSAAQGPMLDIANSVKVDPKFMAPAGVFVTLSKNGKTRACWGSVYPREASAARETVLATLGALNKEYRFKRISPLELKNLKIQVTVIRGLSAVPDTSTINPLVDGVMVRSGGRGGVILPGEAVDAYYELVLAKLKAGIKPSDPCQIYKMKAEIYD